MTPANTLYKQNARGIGKNFGSIRVFTLYDTLYNNVLRENGVGLGAETYINGKETRTGGEGLGKC